MAEGLGHAYVSSICLDRSGSLWAGTMRGLHRIRSGRVESFPPRHVLAAALVQDVTEDREGNLWVATHDGLYRLRDASIGVFSEPEGLPHASVTPIVEDAEGTAWLGTRKGMCAVRNGKVFPLDAVPGMSDLYVLSLAVDPSSPHSFWIGTYGRGLFHLSGRGTKGPLFDEKGNPSFHSLELSQPAFAAEFAGSHVRVIHTGRGGEVWIGGDRGLFRWSAGHLARWGLSEGLPGRSVLALLEDRAGALWIGTSSGVRILRNGHLEKPSSPILASEALAYGLFLDSQDIIWAATLGRGLWAITPEKIAAVTTAEGLPNDSIFSLTGDENNLWAGSNRGVLMISRQSALDAMAGRRSRLEARVLGEHDGMRSSECMGGGHPAATTMRDGKTWMATVDGAAVIDPSRFLTNPVKPPVSIEEMQVDGKEVRASVPAEGWSLLLPPGRSRIEIHYSALSLVAPERVRFRYRLEGYDPEWVEAGSRRVAYYTGLPPGTYTFRVTACNDDGLWNHAGASLDFSLQPFFHQTRWFQGLIALAIAAAALGAFRLRVRHLEEKRAELERLVRERTHSLEEAQRKIDELLASSPRALEDVPSWVAREVRGIAEALRLEGISAVALAEDGPLSLSGDGVPLSKEEILALKREPAPRGDGDRLLIPAIGMSGRTLGAVAVALPARRRLDASELRLLQSFAHQLGGVLEMKSMREELEAARERRALRRQELLDRGLEPLQTCPQCGACHGPDLTVCPEDGHPLVESEALPTRISGRYRLTRVLGGGGMGQVFEALDERLERIVAIKVIRPERLGDPDVRSRFEHEAQSVARLSHPGIVSVHDYGEIEGGALYIVMERLEGHDLETLLFQRGAGTPHEAARLMTQAASALRAAHEAGLVHRDVKPGNLFLLGEAENFQVKVLDFGLAKSMRIDVRLTQAGAVVGTPAYMSPEQVLGRDLDNRSDIYSLAAVFFEALTGRRLVPPGEFAEICMHVVGDLPVPISKFLPAIPASVDSAFLAALAKDPQKRPGAVDIWVESFVKDLESTPSTVLGWFGTRPRRAAGSPATEHMKTVRLTPG